MRRLGGWLLVLAGLGLLGYIIWLAQTYPELRTWGAGLATGFVASVVSMQGIRVLDRHPKKKPKAH